MTRETRVRLDHRGLTLIDGLAFSISARDGEFDEPDHGFIARDARHLSRLRLAVDGLAPLHLGMSRGGASDATIHGYLTRESRPDPAIEVIRRREVRGQELIEQIVIRNWGPRLATLTATVDVATDFADIFQLRRPGELTGHGDVRRRIEAPDRLEFGLGRRRTRICFDPVPTDISDERAQWLLAVEPGGETAFSVTATALGGGDRLVGTGEYRSRRGGRGEVRIVSEPAGFGDACARSFDDFSALTMRDPMDPRRRLLAAGIPWFVALFGRDSLIASYQLRLAQPGQLVSTLQSLAARQGTRDNPGNEEQPGKILHEVRFTDNDWLGEGTARGARPYFGSIDATPLFLMMTDTARRWGASRADIGALLPAARAALDWIRTGADSDDDGFLEYAPHGTRTLTNQGWKDSGDAIQSPEGVLASGPIALVEVQAYAFAARRAFAATLEWAGHESEAAALRDEAEHLRRHICDAFWVDDGEGGHFALALDGQKNVVETIASNMGHVLWAGLATPAQASRTADLLSGEELFSGWGVRTMDREARGFNPLGYHIGSVWPHDTALAVDGLLSYGLDTAALKIADGLIDAMASFDGQLPELFGGHPREPDAGPVPYPTACRPQAWAAGVPLALCASLLGIRPDVAARTLELSPVLPPSLARLELHGIPIGDGVLSVAVEGEEVEILERPEAFATSLVPRPRSGGPPVIPQP